MKTALYRKYRPTSFDGVIGQDVIVTTLTNQIKKGVVSHAYLFTGSRGTGKTSCAKIFARAINCKTPINGSPCGECEVCKALASPSNLDIVEMDAASNNGVDKIRDLRESVGYLPSAGKYKVYIIDEVHMLSGSAFNALLKTLEEPPAHVVFILCTTEVHKLPATILSRCMRFDFRLVPTDKLFALVKDIFEKEGVTADDKAIMHIAKLGEGSVRDTLSVADRCKSASDNLTYELVLEITGSGSNEDTAALMEAVIDSDVGGVIKKAEQMAAEGRSVSRISRDLTVYARDLMLYMTSGESGQSAESVARMAITAKKTDIGFLVRLVRTIGGADAEIRYSTAPRIALESALLSLCTPSLATDSTAAGANAQSSAPTDTSQPYPAAQSNNTPQSDIAPQPEIKNKTAPVAKPAAVPDFEKPNGRTDEKALEVLGRIRRTLRTSGFLRLFGEYGALPDDRVRIVGDKFVVYVDDGSYLVFNEPDNFAAVRSVVESCGYTLVIEKLKSGIDPLEQIIKSVQGLEITVIKK